MNIQSQSVALQSVKITTARRAPRRAHTKLVPD
jgi:hypothetical protein